MSISIRCLLALQMIYIVVVTRANDPEGVGGGLNPEMVEFPSRFLEEAYAGIPPCPNAEEIKPCVCKVNTEYHMYMDCSQVTSEEELRTIFNKEFRYKDFYMLTIKYNKSLKTLRAGDLGDSTFNIVDIEMGVLEEIEEEAFVRSYDTLYTLRLKGNQLKTVPDISHFKNLNVLEVASNRFKSLPILKSTSLDTLLFYHNNIETVSNDAFSGLPAITHIRLYENSISEILPGTFAHLTNLEVVDLSKNHLTTLPEDEIHLVGSMNSLILNNNRITRIPPGSFSGLAGELSSMYMNQNSLTELDEEVWSPLLDDDVSVYLEENPFACDCDVAWLILNQSLLERVRDEPRCSDGQRFVDLNPIFFEEFC